MPDNSLNSVMFAVQHLHTIPSVPAANCHFCPHHRRSFSRFIRPGQPEIECGCCNQRKLRFLYCIIFPNTFIQCNTRMNCALAERCTVHPKTSCRASYATNSRPISWPVILKPGESACRATPATAIRRAPSSPVVGHSSSGPSPSTSSAPGCRALTTPVSGNANPFIPGLRRSGFLTYVSYSARKNNRIIRL